MEAGTLVVVKLAYRLREADDGSFPRDYALNPVGGIDPARDEWMCVWGGGEK